MQFQLGSRRRRFAVKHADDNERVMPYVMKLLGCAQKKVQIFFFKKRCFIFLTDVCAGLLFVVSTQQNQPTANNIANVVQAQVARQMGNLPVPVNIVFLPPIINANQTPTQMAFNFSAWEALELSRRLVSRRWFDLFFLMLLSMFISYSGILLLFVGIFLTYPLGAVWFYLLFDEVVARPVDEAAAGRGY